MPVSQTEGCIKNPLYRFLEEPFVLYVCFNPLEPKGSTWTPKEQLIYEETACHMAIKFCMELEGNISM